MNLNFYTTGVISLILGLFFSCNEPRSTFVEIPTLDFKLTEENGFVLPEGWQATLWAESPDLYNPTNMDVDQHGRIWVTEAVNYRDFNNKPDKYLNFEQGDRIMILEDTNGDGKADSSKLYVQDKDLIAPMGIAVIGNKVFVSCAPNLLVYTDENNDDIPDKKEIFLTGFGGRDHDHSLHSLAAGPDGKFYFNTGNAGPHIVTDKAGWTLRSGSVYTGGTPYNKHNEPALVSDDDRIWVGGLALRIDKDGSGLEVMGHNFRNAYELALDSYGNMWQNDNDDGVETCRTTWLMEGGNAGFFNADGSRTWRVDQKPGQDIFTDHWHQNDPGVIPAGDQTGAGSPTGVVVYEGDAFGAQFQGALLSADAGRNVIFAYQPDLNGAGFNLKRRDLISSMNESTEGYIWHEVDGNTRKWFRPSDVTIGTDGAIYISDWYDPVVGGHKMLDSVGYGRIYRITPKGENLKIPNLDLSTTSGQIMALLNPAVNVRYLGFEKLKAQGETVIKDVEKLLASANPYHQARALWLLSQLGDQGVKIVEENLRSAKNPRMRVTSYRALKSNQKKILEYAKIAVDDPSPMVRREVAISLRDVPWKKCKNIVVQLFNQFDGKDRWYLEALGMALEGKEDLAYDHLLKKQSKDPVNWTTAFAMLAWRLHPKSSINAFKDRALSEYVPDSLRLRAVDALAFINEKEAVEAMLELAQIDSDLVVNELANYWLNHRKNNDWYDLWNWRNFEKSEKFQIPDKIVELERKMLDNQLSMDRRIEAANEMAGSAVGGSLLMSHAAEGRLTKEIIAGVSKTIFSNPEQEIRTLASEYFEKPGIKKHDVSMIFSLKGDYSEGEKTFLDKCMVCHKIGDLGNDIGPKLATIGEKFDKIAILDAILNPSSSIAFGFEPLLIKTKSGQTFYGFLLSEGKTTVIKDIVGNKIVIDTETIESKQQMKTSIMPDANSLGLNEQDLANLTSYLLNLK